MTRQSELSHEMAAPAVTLPVSGVFNMEMARRLSPELTVRSTCYKEKFVSLASVDRALVGMMESRLYIAAPRAHSCRLDRLHLPDSRFDSPEGRIWFHYSPKQRKFVLGYFELNKRRDDVGSGGGFHAVGGGYRRGGPSGWSDGLAARLAQLLAADRYDAYDIDLVAWLVGDKAHPHYRVCIDGLEFLLSDPAPRGKLLLEIAHSCRSWNRAEHAPVLPSWSLLARTARVREQIESRYARAIFAGEALCRVAQEIGCDGASGRLLLVGPLARRVGFAPYFAQKSRALLEESLRILSAVHEGRPTRFHRGESCHFLTASFMDDDMMADVRRLALVRSEMTFRMAFAVIRATEFETNDCDAAIKRYDLNRYALLSEFVRISSAYFDDAGRDIFDDDVVDTLTECAYKERAVISSLIHGLGDFGCSTTMIVDELELDDSNEGPADWDTMYDRLCVIATELLEPRATMS